MTWSWWNLVWLGVGGAGGFTLAAICCMAGRADRWSDDHLTYDKGFRAGYDQAEHDRDFTGEIAAAAQSNLGR